MLWWSQRNRFNKYWREGEEEVRNSGQRKGIAELPALLVPIFYKLAWKVVKIVKENINLKFKRMSFKKEIAHLALSFNS